MVEGTGSISLRTSGEGPNGIFTPPIPSTTPRPAVRRSAPRILLMCAFIFESIGDQSPLNLHATCCPSLNLLRPTFGLGGRGDMLSTDTLQENAGRLIARVLRYELAPNLGENGLVDMIDQLAGAGGLGGEAADPSEGFSIR